MVIWHTSNQCNGLIDFVDGGAVAVRLLRFKWRRSGRRSSRRSSRRSWRSWSRRRRRRYLCCLRRAHHRPFPDSSVRTNVAHDVSALLRLLHRSRYATVLFRTRRCRLLQERLQQVRFTANSDGIETSCFEKYVRRISTCNLERKKMYNKIREQTRIDIGSLEKFLCRLLWNHSERKKVWKNPGHQNTIKNHEGSWKKKAKIFLLILWRYHDKSEGASLGIGATFLRFPKLVMFIDVSRYRGGDHVRDIEEIRRVTMA